MNVVVAGGSQIYLQDQWRKKLASPIDHVGNLVRSTDLRALTRDVELKAVMDYRNAAHAANSASEDSSE